MGDRALIQITNHFNTITDGASGDRTSPVLYLHWRGSEVPKLLNRLMTDFLPKRGPDVSYAFARFTQYACEETGLDQTLGVGVWNQHAALAARDTHGDAGVFVVNLKTKTIRHGGGYAPEGLSEEWVLEKLA